MTDPDWGDGPLDARKARLIDVLETVPQTQRMDRLRLRYNIVDIEGPAEQGVAVAKRRSRRPAPPRPRVTAVQMQLASECGAKGEDVGWAIGRTISAARS
jgi:hypothetical protein